MMKLFVGFEFSNDSLLARKITGFRKRFDPKYNHYSFAHMALLAPFESLDYQVKDIEETLKEELETFYYGKKEMPKLGLTGLGIYQHKRKNILYLNPLLDTDLEYCQEIVQEICESNLAPNLKYKPNKRQFLPLGYFQNSQDLELVMDQAKMEFTGYSELPINSISLFEKRGSQWVKRETLFDFEIKDSRFLHLNQASL